jgi:DNA-binding transcriptional ArsR family regulator
MTEVLDKDSLKALSADTRQEIVKLLEKRPYTASEISKKLNKHVTTVSEHLTTLEKSGLIRRKDSTNKWVYYALTNKGEKLFKPAYYSWVIVLSLSMLCLMIGLQQIFMSTGSLAGLNEEKAVYAPTAERNATQGTCPVSADTNLIIGTVLITLAVIGFGFLAVKKLK